MVVKDLINFIFDSICVYKEIGDVEFEDLYQGNIKDAPIEILNMEVKSIGAKRKDVVDIRVE